MQAKASEHAIGIAYEFLRRCGVADNLSLNPINVFQITTHIHSQRVLRHTGIRAEELLELSHHSITQYRLPSTGELGPLLQIAPSKTDAERLLLVNPELADVLSAIVWRNRTASGAVPLALSYDVHERLWNPPMSLLFQRAIGGENRACTRSAIRKLLINALAATGLTNSEANRSGSRPTTFAVSSSPTPL